MSYGMHWSACPVMTAEEVHNLDDALAYDRSAELEHSVREQAARCAESCLATGKPWRCYFIAPLSFWADALGEIPASVEVTVDVRGVRNLDVATLIAEEQIRRQLAKHAWAKLPDLGGDR